MQDTEPCSFEKHLPDPKYTQMLEKIDIKDLNCIRMNNYSLNLTTDPAENKYLFFNFYISECNNSTLNNSSCYPKEKIKNIYQYRI